MFPMEQNLPISEVVCCIRSCSFICRSVENDCLIKTMLEAYLAFEALTDHPYEFSSEVHGFFPFLASCDGCNKLATNNMTLEKFLAQRGKQVIDMDLSACWVTLSMLSPMLFSKRLQTVYTTLMTFSRYNRKSNVFVLEEQGAVSKIQELDGLNYQAVLDLVNGRKDGKGLDEALASADLKTLNDLYKKCLMSQRKKPGSM